MKRPSPVIQVARFPVSSTFFKDRLPVQAKAEIGIGIIHHDVQDVPGKFQIVQVAEKSVGRDEVTSFKIWPHNIRLILCKADRTVRNKAVIIQHLMGIMSMIEHADRQTDLIPAAITLAPENRSPGIIQGLQILILRLQPDLEGRPVCVRIKLIGLTVDLVVDLPADDLGVPSEVLCHLCGDNTAFIQINRRIIIVVASAAVLIRGPLAAAVQDFRIFPGQPGRRRCRRGSQDDLHPLIFTQGQEIVEK